MGNIYAAHEGPGKQVIKGGNTNIKIGGTVIIIGILVLVFIFAKGGFSSPQNRIIGTWQSERGATYVFGDDGQYSSTGGWFGSYSVDGDTLTLCPVMNNPQIYTIEISSDQLVLYEKDGSIYIELKRFK